MEIQYLLVNNDSAETITVKFKHCEEFKIQLELHTPFITDFVEIYEAFAINN